jgi:S-DNA-T family DNA segregation ATPase FtsK/SpoIIIE
VVFEGGAPAQLRDNPGIAEAMSQRDTDPEVPRAATGYVGEPVSIKAHTGATFRRQSGSNLLVVGQRDQQALGVLGCTLLSLAARHRAEHARFLILDATPADDPSASLLSDLCDALPHDCTIERLRGAATIMDQVATELDRRETLDTLGTEPSVYVLVAGLHRFRDLRRSEDDYSFSMDSMDDPPTAAKPDKTFARLIREGPVLGMHAIAWCDTVANVERAMDRQTTREFDHRVLFQMNATDSSVLIDNPAASTLGLHRALFSSEETGSIEKFRPYELPTLADVPR